MECTVVEAVFLAKKEKGSPLVLAKLSQGYRRGPAKTTEFLSELPIQRRLEGGSLYLTRLIWRNNQLNLGKAVGKLQYMNHGLYTNL